MNKIIEEINSFSGKINKLYYSIEAASEALKLPRQKILNLINNKIKYNRKYYQWHNINNEIKLSDPFPIKQKLNNQIINQFKSVAQAAQLLNYNRNTISNHIKNQTIDKWGCYWENYKKLL